MDVDRTVAYRQFCNKIWNAIKYTMHHTQDTTLPSVDSRDALKLVQSDMGLPERWILSRLATAVKLCNHGLETFHLGASVAALYKFFLNDLCDVYIEFSKLKQDTAQQHCTAVVLHSVMNLSMQLFHPFMPFITEELYMRLNPHQNSSILDTSYPEPDQMSRWIDPQVEESMQVVLDVVHAVRSLRHTRNTLSPQNDSTELGLIVCCTEQDVRYNLVKNTLPVRLF